MQKRKVLGKLSLAEARHCIYHLNKELTLFKRNCGAFYSLTDDLVRDGNAEDRTEDQVISGALDHDAAVFDIRVIPAEAGVVLLIHRELFSVIYRSCAKNIMQRGVYGMIIFGQRYRDICG